MQKLRVSEIFGGNLPDRDVIPVIQGEGRFVGTPSIFVRLFGCNLRCPGFGIPGYKVGTKNIEVTEIIESLPQFKTLEDLPKVTTGCDTYYAVYPAFKRFSTDYTPQELVTAILSRAYTPFKPPHVVFTGGEPLLWCKSLLEVLEGLSNTVIKEATFETNGTIELTQEFIKVVSSLPLNITWSVSPKLSCAGHSRFETYIPEALRSYNKILNSKLYLKFVVDQSDQTLDDLFRSVKQYSFDGVEIDDVYLMPEGGNFDDSFVSNCQYVVKICSQYGFNYSPRLQVELFNNVVGS